MGGGGQGELWDGAAVGPVQGLLLEWDNARQLYTWHALGWSPSDFHAWHAGIWGACWC